LFKRRRPYKIVIALVFSSIALILFFILVDIKLRDVFFDIAEIKAVQLAAEAVQKSIQREAADENLQYQDLIIIHKDNQGRVALMQADALKVNRVATGITIAVQKTLEDLRWQSFSIPLGQLLGVPILANYGPRIKYSIMPVGTVRFSITDRFDSAGINQTRHTIYLNLDTNVRIVVPFKTAEAVVSTQVPLTESIIVGGIPDTFVTVPGGIFGSGAISGSVK